MGTDSMSTYPERLRDDPFPDLTVACERGMADAPRADEEELDDPFVGWFAKGCPYRHPNPAVSAKATGEKMLAELEEAAKSLGAARWEVVAGPVAWRRTNITSADEEHNPKVFAAVAVRMFKEGDVPIALPGSQAARAQEAKRNETMAPQQPDAP